MKSQKHSHARVTICLFFLVAVLLPAMSRAQTQQEMQEEMIQQLDDLRHEVEDLEKQIAEAKANKDDVETIQELEKELAQSKRQLAIMEGLGKNLAKIEVSEAALQQAQDAQSGALPQRDMARINALPQKVLSDGELAVFVNNIHKGVEGKISLNQKALALLVANKAKEQNLSADAIATMASAFWMNNYAEIAVYLMAKAAAMDSANPDNLNNLSAFLTMTGGEHLAIPILENLHQKYPNNSTVLNNLGQAWMGLGDSAKAKKYLEEATQIYPGHSMANKTLSRIAKAEGNTAKAVEYIKKSIQESYSGEKAAMLNDLGGKLTAKDFRKKYPGPKESFGLHKFIPPSYPTGINDVKQRDEEWKSFREQIAAAVDGIAKEERAFAIQIEAYKKKLGNINSQRTMLKPLYSPPFAQFNAMFLAGIFTDTISVLQEKEQVIIDSAKNQEIALRDTYGKDYQTIRNRYSNCPGEGDPCYKPMCTEMNAKYSDYLKNTNGIWEIANQEVMRLARAGIDENLYYAMYLSMDKSQWEMEKAKARRSYLQLLGSLYYLGGGGIPCDLPKKDIRSMKKGLPDFDEVNCQYITELDTPVFEDAFSIRVECNKMITKFDLPFIKGELRENLNTDKLIDVTKGSIEISKGVGTDVPIIGPISAEAKATAGAFLEFDNSGISDVGIIGDVTAGVQAEGLDTAIKAAGGSESLLKPEGGVSVRWGVNSGTRLAGTGIFQGVNATFK